MVDFGAVLRRIPTRAEVVGSIDQLALARDAASPFVPGESVGSAVEAVREAAESGMSASVLYLPLPDAEEAARVACLQVIEALAIEDLSVGTDLAVDPVALGLGRVGEQTLRSELALLCAAAARAGMTVTFTSVSHDLVEPVLALRDVLVAEVPDVGVTLTANLHRTEGDCLDLARSGARVRLLRREVVEPSGVAFTDSHEIDRAFVRCTRLLMDSGARPVIATDDQRLLDIAGALAERAERTPDEYTFQFRRGVAEVRAAELVAAGAAVSILVPFGPDWAAYVARWIAMRPSSVGKAVGAAIGRSDR
jgi:proline dehydrogenase